MAVDRYIDSLIDSAGNVTKLLDKFNTGGKLGVMYETFAKAATDNQGSVLRVFKALDKNIIPVAILIACDAITGLTAVDVGLYKSGVGKAALVDNCFASGLDLHAGAANFFGNTPFNGLAAVGHASLQQALYQYANETLHSNQGKYDLCLTLDGDLGNTGNISVLMLYANGNL